MRLRISANKLVSGAASAPRFNVAVGRKPSGVWGSVADTGRLAPFRYIIEFVLIPWYRGADAASLAWPTCGDYFVFATLA